VEQPIDPLKTKMSILQQMLRLITVTLKMPQAAMLLVACWAIAGYPSVSQPLIDLDDRDGDRKIGVSTVVDRDQVWVADSFRLTLEATIAGTGATDSTVVFPAVEKNLGMWEVISHQDQFAIPIDAAQTRWKRDYLLESLHSGSHEIPSLLVTINGQPYPSDPMLVTVNSSVDPQRDPTEMQPFKAPLKIPSPLSPDGIGGWSREWIAGAALLAGFACLAAAFLLKRRSAQPSPELWALIKIKELEHQISVQNIGLDRSLPMIANLLRQFIQRRWGITATAQTTTEFLDTMAVDLRLSRNQQQELQQFLQEVDRIKFASYQPSGESAQSALEQAERFIRQATETQPSQPLARPL